LRRTNLLKRKGGYMRKIAFIVSILTCFTLLIIGFPYVGECAEYEMNTDRPGKDYHCYDLPIDDISAGTTCKSDCESDSICIAWTYIKPNATNGPHARCCKKSDMPEKKTDACCISGVKPCPKINVTSPTLMGLYSVNQACPIQWDTTHIKNYGQVFLFVVQYDPEHRQGWEGGGFPVSNTGKYEWIIPANVGPTSWQNDEVLYAIKVATPDRRCIGYSKYFDIVPKTINQIPQEIRKKMNISP
jgi:hypothetical protein